MVNKFTKPLGTLLTAALLVASSHVRADDTEIYTGPGGAGGSPLVFFYIEYTPNLASTVCTGVYEDDPATTTVNEDNIATACPQIEPLKSYMAANDLTATDTTIDQFELTRAALKRVLIALGDDTHTIQVGLLMAHDNLASCNGGPSAVNCSQGGYILKGATRLYAPSDTFNPATATVAQVNTELALAKQANKKALFEKLDALASPQGGFSHENQNKEIYFELFRYLTGQGIYNGHNGWVDYGTDKTYNLGIAYVGDYTSSIKDLSNYYVNDLFPIAPDVAWWNGLITGTSRFIKAPSTIKANDDIFWGDFAPVDGKFMFTYPLKWDVNIESGSNYIAALNANCQKVYVINVVDGGGNSADDANTAIKASLSSGGMGFNVSNSDTGFEQMVKWLYDKDLADGTFGTAGNLLDKQNVVSYFIAKQPQQVDQAAQYGGSGFAIALTDDAQSVVDAISAIFSNIIDASTTFTSAAIPVNVFNRSEVVDNAYIALFQPNIDSAPGWVGNVKKLKMEIYVQCNLFDTVDPTKCISSENRLRLIDTTPINAISDTTGRIVPEAITFWTRTDGYDLYDNIGTSNGENEVAGHDGRSVNRGGSGQRIPNLLAADGTQGLMNWANSSTGRRLFTEPESGASPGSDLLPLEWNNIEVLWPTIFNTNTDDGYTVADHWQTAYSSAGTTAALTGTWSTDRILYAQDPGIATTAVKNYYDNSGASTTVNAASFTIEQQASNILAYMRGYDVNDTDTDGIRTESRRWLFNDPLHSRPLPINYGARGGYTADDPATPDVNESNPDIRILVGSNDGYLRMIRNTNTDGTESGQEVWAFMPREVMKIQKQLMDNSTFSVPDHPYALDGAASAYVKDSDGTIGYCLDASGNLNPCSSDKAWVFVGLRRGGRAYYGLDVTDPDNPKYLWTVTNHTAGFSELGFTFGQPVIRHLKWSDSPTPTQARPVLIVGGGYDLNKDTDSPTLLGTDDSMGRTIYIIDAQTGDLVWKATGNSSDTDIGTSGVYKYDANMDDSIPSEVTAIDGSGDGIVDRVYVGDTGGRVWRIDLPSATRSEWKVSELLNVGRHSVAVTATTTEKELNDRRFFFAPDVVPSSDVNGDFDAVVIGSGNREHPRQNQTDDYIYMYKDRCTAQPLGSGCGFTATVTPSSLGDVTNNCIQQVVKNGCTNPDLSNGWKLLLEGDGEKSLASALTLRGAIYFSTYLPNTGSVTGACSPNEGEGYLYTVALKDAVAVINYDTTNTVIDADGKEHELQKNDRKRILDSPGIPSENVYVSFRDEENKTINCVLASDLNCGSDLGLQQWSTYWFEKQK